MNNVQPFHLAIPVIDLQKMRDFYTALFQCEVGRTDTKWVDLNFYGHQLVLHEVDSLEKRDSANKVDGKTVRVPHFGVVLAWSDWQDISERLKHLKIQFIVEPYIRFEGKVGEQATMFLEDIEGNALEFKAFRNPDQLFAK